MELEHVFDEEWIWNVEEQDYVILYIHIETNECPACAVGAPIKEE